MLAPVSKKPSSSAVSWHWSHSVLGVAPINTNSPLINSMQLRLVARCPAHDAFECSVSEQRGDLGPVQDMDSGRLLNTLDQLA
jgi:hypothetical protein